MALSNPVQAPLTAIVRTTPDERLTAQRTNADANYGKFSAHDGSTGGIGFSQPFVVTKLTDSSFSKNLTKYDSQALPIGSTVRDLERVGKFMASGQGLIFLGKQFLLQNQNAFNETRLYNPLSVLGATANSATLGLLNRPKRFVNSGNGLLDTFTNALKSSIGIPEGEATIQGTATGDQNGVGGASPISNYATARGGAKAGLVRYQTATAAISRFSSTWVASTGATGGQGGGFLANLGQTLKNTLSKAIPSTNPMGVFGGAPSETWKFRPEYNNKTSGPYYAFLDETTGLLDIPSVASSIFYNDPKATTSGTTRVIQFHKYSPAKDNVRDVSKWYAPSEKLKNDPTTIGVKTDIDGQVSDSGAYYNNLVSLHQRMVALIGPDKSALPQRKASMERYSEVKDYNPTVTSYPTYKDIPDQKNGNAKFYSGMIKAGALLVDRPNPFAKGGTAFSRYFAGASGSGVYDAYNSILPDKSFNMKQARNVLPYNLSADEGQSRDLIYFYFYDLVNEIYLPFRATISGLGEQHSADWEDVKYMGRSDRLFVYRGFSRDVNFVFSVYANSVKELIPMWTRINYLVGLTRPSKYTAKGISTSGNSSTGAESSFIYPPMVTLRLGDLFYDQPCVISSVGVNIPDDTNWETLRSDGSYSYLFGPNSAIKVNDVNSRQLPLKADISISLKVLEKERAETSSDHYGYNAPLSPV